MDLAGTSGLPVEVEEDGTLSLGQGVAAEPVAVRRLEDLRPVLRDAAAVGPAELYRMYRGVAREEHRAWCRAHAMRYDITVLVPGRLGDEYVKTAGHYHPPQPGSPLTFGEVYEVLAGRALFVLQKSGRTADVIDDLVLIEAGPAEKVLIPSGYGHVTVNISPGLLALANWVDPSFQAYYEPFRLLGGAACHILDDGGEPAPAINPRYARVPEPRRIRPDDTWARLPMPREPIYLACLRSPSLFEGILRPQTA